MAKNHIISDVGSLSKFKNYNFNPENLRLSSKLLNVCNLKKQISLEVHCSKGTYIRSLVEDLGKKLNCFATVIALRRIAIGKFEFNNYDSYIFNIEKLNEIRNNNFNLNKLLLPIQDSLNALPKLVLNNEQVLMLFQGKSIYIENFNGIFIDAKNKLISLFFGNKFLGIGEINNNFVISKRLINQSFINISLF